MSPQRRDQILQELQSLGAAGVVGAEAYIDELDEKLAAADTIEFLGQEMTLEQALADKGISDIIAQAVNDPNLMGKMKEDPNYVGLATFIEENNAALKQLADEYTAQGTAFEETQQQYKTLQDKFGPDSKELMETLLGSPLEDSVLASDLQAMESQLQTSPLWQVLQNDNMLVNELKGNTDLAQEFMNSGLSQEQIESSVALKRELEADSDMQKLLGMDPEYQMDAQSLQELESQVERYEDLEPRVVQAASGLI